MAGDSIYGPGGVAEVGWRQESFLVLKNFAVIDPSRARIPPLSISDGGAWIDYIYIPVLQLHKTAMDTCDKANDHSGIKTYYL